MKSEKIFIAFGGNGAPMQQDERHSMAEGYECWNLTKIPFDTFIEYVKKEIPPVNASITDENYKTDIWGSDIGKIYMDQAKWGLLLPTPTGQYSRYGYEVIHALHLFSPTFLYPLFHVADMGCWATPHSEMAREYGQNYQLFMLGQSDQSHFFRTKNFVDYYQKMFDALDYYGHDRSREDSWDQNDWQLCWVHSLFADLRRYQNTGKKQGFFLRECVDLCVILESLNNKKEDGIKYKLKKRISALLLPFLPDTEDTIDKLYDLRSEYIHGNIFRKMKGFDDGSPSSEDFNFLEKCTAYVRYFLVAYTYLFLHRSSFSFSEQRVMSWLESAILDCNLRAEIQRKAHEILHLLPPVAPLAT